MAASFSSESRTRRPGFSPPPTPPSRAAGGAGGGGRAGRALGRVDGGFQATPAGPIHRLAGELVLVPPDGAVLGGGPALQVGKLTADILPVFLAHADVDADVFQ